MRMEILLSMNNPITNVNHVINPRLINSQVVSYYYNRISTLL
jgi:hypothetical protein